VLRRGWRLVRIEEDIESGRSMRNRPGLCRALDACRSGAVSGVVAAKLDRLSRSIVDFGGLLDEARKRGFNVVCIDLGVDLSTPQGELIANVLASVAQWERRIIGQRTRDALAVKRQEGVRLGRPRSVPDDVLKSIRRAHRSGRTLTSIAARLNATGVPTARGWRCWYPATVRQLLLQNR
jgi:DNA invertase Pin-like site-specific DNA recombinase